MTLGGGQMRERDVVRRRPALSAFRRVPALPQSGRYFFTAASCSRQVFENWWLRSPRVTK